DERGLRVRGMTAPTRPSAARPGRPADLRGGPRARGTGRPSPPARRRPGTSRTPWPYLAPALVVLGGLLAYPLYQLGLISLFDSPQAQVSGREPTTFKGFGNYSELLADDQFWQVLLATVVFAAVCVVSTLAVGCALAVLLTRVRALPRLALMLA